MKRGDIVVAAPGGPFGRKPRPYVVIQSDIYRTPLVVLLGCTTGDEPSAAFRPRLSPSGANGLRSISEVMVDVPIATRRSKVGQVIGQLDDDELSDIEVALVLFMGLTEQ